MKMTGGRAIVEAARANGMRTIFGLPGAQIYALFDGLHATGIDVIVPRHEQAAAYMAMGYAKSTGRTGAFTVVPGPGVLNTAAALCTAMGNCAPVVCLTGQVPSQFLGKGRGHLHELADQAGDSAHADQGRRPHRRPGGAGADRDTRVPHRAQRPAGAGVGGDVLGHDGGGETDVDIGPGDTARDEPEPDLDAIARRGRAARRRASDR